MRNKTTELVDAVEAYFVAWSNHGKKPGWCKRVAAAKANLDAAVSRAKQTQKPKI